MVEIGNSRPVNVDITGTNAILRRKDENGGIRMDIPGGSFPHDYSFTRYRTAKGGPYTSITTTNLVIKRCGHACINVFMNLECCTCSNNIICRLCELR